MIKPAVIASMLLVASGVQAADWQDIGGKQQSVAIDPQSVQWRGDFATFWAQITPRTGNLAGGGKYLIQLSCSTQQIRIAVTPGVMINDNPLGSGNSSPYTFQPATGAISSLIRSRVCSAQPRPKLVEASTIPGRGPQAVLPPRGRIPGPTLQH